MNEKLHTNRIGIDILAFADIGLDGNAIQPHNQPAEAPSTLSTTFLSTCANTIESLQSYNTGQTLVTNLAAEHAWFRKNDSCPDQRETALGQVLLKRDLAFAVASTYMTKRAILI